MIEEVFKKGKKQREVAKKFDQKIAERQGTNSKRDKYRELKKVSYQDFLKLDSLHNIKTLMLIKESLYITKYIEKR